MTAEAVFEHLQPHHDRQAFDCGVGALNEFLRRQARQNATRDIGVTHVAVRTAGDAEILAYYTLVTRTVTSDSIPSKKIPPGDVGVVLLGRLAVAKSARHMGLGRLCVMRAMSQTARAARDIGIHALVLDCLDERARDWYLSLEFGFEPFVDDRNRLYSPVNFIKQLGLGDGTAQPPSTAAI